MRNVTGLRDDHQFRAGGPGEFNRVGSRHYPIIVAGDDQDGQFEILKVLKQTGVVTGHGKVPECPVPIIGLERPGIAVPGGLRDPGRIMPCSPDQVEPALLD